jgi:hypothetical protein
VPDHIHGDEVVEVEVLEGREGGEDGDDVMYSALVEKRKMKRR